MNRSRNKILLSLLAAAGLAVASAGASAQATRTWVSGVGDDANPCSRTAPCKTFAGAISKTATGGLINVLDPGGFGSVTITKSISIDGGGRSHGGILGASVNGVVVNAPADAVVVIRNLSIDSPLTTSRGVNGIRFIAGGSLHVENVQIRGFATRGIDFSPSGASRLFVTGSDIHNNGSAVAASGGIFIGPTGTGLATATITDTRSNDNNFGLRVNGRSVVSVRNSIFSGNSNFGIAAVGTADFANVLIDGCQASNNAFGPSVGAGILSDGALADVQIANCSVSNNENGLRVQNGGIIRSFGNNRVFDNDTNGAPTATINEI
jgi:hypothetical protein